ncbi:MAG: hypothetical protein J3K34DRAFT_420526 [Monoraphidium minutum]|nr:MAG: hypothetical protein J3K34DRAFT_420526 [Monoraphidium minutum]
MLQVLPRHPLFELGALGINTSCRGLSRRRGRSLLQTEPPPLPPLRVTTVPRVAISYILNPAAVPEPRGPDAIDKFVGRYGAENGTINPDMAEAEVTRQIAKLEQLATTPNETIADAARKALVAYKLQQKELAREAAEEAAAVLKAEAALVGGFTPVKATPLRTSVAVGEFTSLNPAPRIKLDGLEGLPDGYYCMQVIVTVLRNTGYMGEFKVPARDLSTSREVCFYKMDAMPSAHVKFHTCGPKFSVELTDVSPTPVEVFPGTKKMLFTPVYHITGTLNKTAQWWVPIPEGHKQRFDMWAVVGKLPSNTTSYVFVPEDTLADGFWNIEVDGGLLSEFPSLLATDAVSKFGKAEDDPDELGLWRDMPAALQGLPKYAAGRQNLTRLVGLQSRETTFNSFNGPDQVPINEDFTFSWDIEGFGRQFCYIDGERRQNDADFMCKSPINAQVNDDKTNHTLLIIMQDACGQKVRVFARYGLWGYALEEATSRGDKVFDPSTVADLSAGGGLALAGKKTERHHGHASGAARAGGAAGVAVAAAAAVAVAAALWL